MPQGLFISDSSLDGNEESHGHPLVLLSYDTIVDEGVQVLSVFSLKHCLEFLLALFTVVCGLSDDIKVFEEVNCTGMKGFPLISLVLGSGSEFGGFPVRGVVLNAIILFVCV